MLRRVARRMARNASAKDHRLGQMREAQRIARQARIERGKNTRTGS